MRLISSVFALTLPLTAHADTPTVVVDAILDEHVLPLVEDLSEKAAILAFAAQSHCAPGSETLRGAYADAFDAWVRFSHLRFRPASVDERVFAGGVARFGGALEWPRS